MSGSAPRHISGRVVSLARTIANRVAGSWVSLVALFTGLFLAGGARPGFTAPAEARRSVSVAYDFAQPKVEQQRGQVLVSVPACQNTSRPGEPSLPFRTARILLPPGYRVEGVTAQPTRPPAALPGAWQIATSQKGNGPPKSDRPSFRAAGSPGAVASRAGSGSGRPFEPARLVAVHRLLGHDIALVNVFPVEYRATNGQLLFSARLNVTVSLSPLGANPGLPLPACGQAQARETVAEWVDNAAMLAEYQASQGTSKPDAPPAHNYLLVTTAALVPSFQPLLEQKRRDGLSVKVETMETITASQPGRDAPEKLRNFIRQACTNWGVQYVLLGGDTATVPCRHAYVHANEAESECHLPSDLYFACLDGSWNRDGDKRWGEPTDGEGGDDVDLLAEVWVGRAPVDTPEEAAAFVAKTIRYEQRGHGKPHRALLAAEHLGKYARNFNAQGGAMLDPLLPHLTNCVVTWLDDRPHPTPQWNGRQALEALNAGPHLVLYGGHGEQNSIMRLTTREIETLTNKDLFLACSVACHAGRFDNDPFSPDCIAEQLVKLPAHGAFAAIFNARVGWFEPGEVWKFSGEYQAHLFDQLSHRGQANLGRAFQLSKHSLLGRVERTGIMAYRWCYFQINLFGDPHIPVQLPPSPSERTVVSPSATARSWGGSGAAPTSNFGRPVG